MISVIDWKQGYTQSKSKLPVAVALAVAPPIIMDNSSQTTGGNAELDAYEMKKFIDGLLNFEDAGDGVEEEPMTIAIPSNERQQESQSNHQGNASADGIVSPLRTSNGGEPMTFNQDTRQKHGGNVSANHLPFLTLHLIPVGDLSHHNPAQNDSSEGPVIDVGAIQPSTDVPSQGGDTTLDE